MTRGLYLLMIWSVMIVICDSSNGMSLFFNVPLFDVPYDHSPKDEATYFKIPEILRTTKRKDDALMELIKKSKDFHPVMPLLFTKRRQNVLSNVEVGPGAFKSEIIHYPSDTLKQQLSNLLKLKKKLEERRRDR